MDPTWLPDAPLPVQLPATQMRPRTDKLLNIICFHHKQWELVEFSISQDSALKVRVVLQFHPLRNRLRKHFAHISTQTRQQHVLLIAGQGSVCQRLCRMHFFTGCDSAVSRCLFLSEVSRRRSIWQVVHFLKVFLN